MTNNLTDSLTHRIAQPWNERQYHLAIPCFILNTARSLEFASERVNNGYILLNHSGYLRVRRLRWSKQPFQEVRFENSSARLWPCTFAEECLICRKEKIKRRPATSSPCWKEQFHWSRQKQKYPLNDIIVHCRQKQKQLLTILIVYYLPLDNINCHIFEIPFNTTTRYHLQWNNIIILVLLLYLSELSLELILSLRSKLTDILKWRNTKPIII